MRLQALTFLVLDLGLDVVNGVRGLHLQRDGLASQGLHEDLHATPQAQHQVQSGLLLDVVVRQGAAILQLLAGKDQTLLIRRDACKPMECSISTYAGQKSLCLLVYHCSTAVPLYQVPREEADVCRSHIAVMHDVLGFRA